MCLPFACASKPWVLVPRVHLAHYSFSLTCGKNSGNHLILLFHSYWIAHAYCVFSLLSYLSFPKITKVRLNQEDGRTWPSLTLKHSHSAVLSCSFKPLVTPSPLPGTVKATASHRSWEGSPGTFIGQCWLLTFQSHIFPALPQPILTPREKDLST